MAMQGKHDRRDGGRPRWAQLVGIAYVLGSYVSQNSGGTRCEEAPGRPAPSASSSSSSADEAAPSPPPSPFQATPNRLSSRASTHRFSGPPRRGGNTRISLPLARRADCSSPARQAHFCGRESAAQPRPFHLRGRWDSRHRGAR